MKLNQGLTTFAFLAMMGIGCTSPTATQVEFDTEGVAVNPIQLSGNGLVSVI